MVILTCNSSLSWLKLFPCYDTPLVSIYMILHVFITLHCYECDLPLLHMCVSQIGQCVWVSCAITFSLQIPFRAVYVFWFCDNPLASLPYWISLIFFSQRMRGVLSLWFFVYSPYILWLDSLPTCVVCIVVLSQWPDFSSVNYHQHSHKNCISKDKMFTHLFFCHAPHFTLHLYLLPILCGSNLRSLPLSDRLPLPRGEGHSKFETNPKPQIAVSNPSPSRRGMSLDVFKRHDWFQSWEKEILLLFPIDGNLKKRKELVWFYLLATLCAINIDQEMWHMTYTLYCIWFCCGYDPLLNVIFGKNQISQWFSACRSAFESFWICFTNLSTQPSQPKVSGVQFATWQPIVFHDVFMFPGSIILYLFISMLYFLFA